MTRFTLALTALATTACLAFPVSATSLSTSDRGFQLAQAEVTVTTTRPAAKKKVVVKKKVVIKKKPVVRKRVVIGTTSPHCRMVTTRVQQEGKLIVKKVRRC